ncbi:MAG: hypothetical protein QNK37_26735 [Acidobacteriota bacterium]|nr:hypothetical protein [Acidobacteriota bacterium]
MSTYALEQLEIVGFADALTEDMVPCVVPPVFRFKDNKEQFLFPPFSIVNRQVETGTIGNRKEFERFLSQEEITPIEPTIPAAANHELWIDMGMEPRYQFYDEKDTNFRRMTALGKRMAEDALKAGDLDKAREACRMAFNANNNDIDVLVLRSLVYERSDESELIEVMQDLATDVCGVETFQFLLAKKRGALQSNPAEVNKMVRRPETTTVPGSHGRKIWIPALAAAVIITAIAVGAMFYGQHLAAKAYRAEIAASKALYYQGLDQMIANAASNEQSARERSEDELDTTIADVMAELQTRGQNLKKKEIVTKEDLVSLQRLQVVESAASGNIHRKITNLEINGTIYGQKELPAAFKLLRELIELGGSGGSGESSGSLMSIRNESRDDDCVNPGWGCASIKMEILEGNRKKLIQIYIKSEPRTPNPKRDYY